MFDTSLRQVMVFPYLNYLQFNVGQVKEKGKGGTSQMLKQKSFLWLFNPKNVPYINLKGGERESEGGKH